MATPVYVPHWVHEQRAVRQIDGKLVDFLEQAAGEEPDPLTIIIACEEAGIDVNDYLVERSSK